MNWDKIIEQAIALLFPLIIVFLFVYKMLKSFFDQFEKQRKQEINLKYAQETMPIRLQAYERLALFIERISPESIIMRVNQHGMTSLDLHKAILVNIREEYEHNLSQQIYVSGKVWAMINAARQGMIQIVSEAAEAHNPDGPANEFATDILEDFAQISDDPLTEALAYLREEAKEIM